MKKKDAPSNERKNKFTTKDKHPITDERTYINEQKILSARTRISVHSRKQRNQSSKEHSTSESVNHTNIDVTRFSPSKKPIQANSDTVFVKPGSPKKECNKNNIKPKKAISRAPCDTPDINRQATEERENRQTTVLKHRFILESILGVGGMGVVYKAKDRVALENNYNNPYVAIKVLSEEFKNHPDAVIALDRESRKTRSIAHPNVVQVHDFDRDGDVVFMTMEYLEGKPLDKLIKQYQATGLPRDDTWNILSGICSALATAHAEGIVHSDFKPGNVFITASGMAKIFDFGIARAVANVEIHTEEEVDEDVFCASRLGALTPAYASREMLLGEAPDVRDDVYALGCVAYELLSGKHPFNQLPADKAYDKNLKPKRINDINKYQWQALESALSFKRKDRIESVDAFYKQLTFKKKPKNMLLPFLLFIAAATYYFYTETKNTSPPDPQISESGIRDKLEFNIRYNLYKESIEKLITKPSFTNEWEDNLLGEMQGLLAFFSEQPNEWYSTKRNRIYQLYVNKIEELIKTPNYYRANIVLNNAYHYTDDKTHLNNKKNRLAKAIRIKKSYEESIKKKRVAIKKVNEKKIATEEKNKQLFDRALANAQQQLKCSKLNMRNVNTAINELRSLDRKKYKNIENSLATQLALCISSIGKSNPARALDAKRYALNVFKDNPTLMAITIKVRDVCNRSIAGRGAQGSAVCRDKLEGGGVGPVLLVIPSKSDIKSFAIGKYETTVTELNKFCKNTPKCNIQTDKSGRLPATNIKISTVSAYLRWLSKKTKEKYRLPTKDEWVYAAKSQPYKLDPNRNCQFSARGIEKGKSLVKAATGKQNRWGLVNYAGNAQEFAFGTGKKLVALGGSHISPMDNCTATTVTKHTGKADRHTGFRVVRNISEK